MMDEWISVNDKLPNVRAGKFRVKRANGVEMDALYYQDAMAWMAFYGKKPSLWWDSRGFHDDLYDVTHWRKDDLD